MIDYIISENAKAKLNKKCNLALYPFPLRNPKAKGKRIFEIDFARGFCISLMLIVHLLYSLGDVNSLFTPPANPPEWILVSSSFFLNVFYEIVGRSLYFLEFFFSGMFMFLSGISSTFSHGNIKRGIQLGILSVLMTIFLETIDLFLPLHVHIYMGILHALAIGMIIYGLVDFFFKNKWVDFGMGVLFAVAVIITTYISYEMSPGNNRPYIDLTSNLVTLATSSKWDQSWKLFFGLAAAGDDYFSPLLTTCLMFLGAALGKLLYPAKKSLIKKDFPTTWAKPILFFGRHSLYVYILHQVVFIVVIFLFLLPFGYRI